ncbi:MAG TPA: hypothetical protein PKM58_05265, partial [Pyrinomonadaceae bacterium]|nr:hypothetical protein [Pyrinomonadaceae bacterium]
MITNTPVTEKEARRIQRLALALPVRVEGKIDRSIGWNEITRLRDVSAFGAGFHLNRPVKRGRLIALTLPMPRQLRCYDHMEPQYKIWGLVRRCISVSTANSPEQYAIGLAFVGKNPPNGYLENPATLYEIIDQNNQGFWHIAEAPNNPDERDLPRELRRHSRYPIPINFLLETLDEDLLRRVVDVEGSQATAPAGSEERADRRLVALCEHMARAGVAGRRGAQHRPAGVLGGVAHSQWQVRGRSTDGQAK